MEQDTVCFHSEKAFKPARRLNLWGRCWPPIETLLEDFKAGFLHFAELSRHVRKSGTTYFVIPQQSSAEGPVLSHVLSNWNEFRGCSHVSDHVGVKGSSRFSLENPSVAEHRYWNVFSAPPILWTSGGGWVMERCFSAGALCFLSLFVISRDKSGCLKNWKLMDTKIQNMDNSWQIWKSLSTRSSALGLSKICKEWYAFKADYINWGVFIIIIMVFKKL